MMIDIIISILMFISFVGIIFCVACVVYAIGDEIYKQTLRYEKFNKCVKVCKKEHKKAYSTTVLMPVGKIMVPQTQYHDEEYIVHVIYDGKKYYIKNEELYNSVNVNDMIWVWVHKGYNNKNEVKNIYITAE